MRNILRLLFGLIFAVMVAGVIWAMRQRGMLAAGSELMPDRWFQVTLLDAYCGFLTFYVWVAYKEANYPARILWFLLIMTLGNIAISIYMLIQLSRLPKDASWSSLLLRTDGGAGHGK